MKPSSQLDAEHVNVGVGFWLVVEGNGGEVLVVCGVVEGERLAPPEVIHPFFELS